MSAIGMPGLPAADGINTLDLPFAHIGMVTGEDVIFPEVFRLLAIKGVDTVLAPYAAQEDWEVKTGLLERGGGEPYQPGCGQCRDPGR